MNKIILVIFLSSFISSVSYSKIKANYKLVCKVFDYGTFQFEKGKDHFFYFDIDFVSSTFLMGMGFNNDIPYVNTILTLDKNKTKINEPNIYPYLWFTQKDDRGETYTISFSNDKISLTYMSLVMSETNNVIGVHTSKSLCNEVKSLKNKL